MTPTTPDPSPGTASRPSNPAAAEEAGRRRTRVRESRAAAVGIGISILVHLVLVFLYPGIMDRMPEVSMSPSVPPVDLPLQGVEIVTVREIEDEPVTQEEEPPPEIILDLPDPVELEEETPFALPLPVPPSTPTPGEGVQATERDPEQWTAAERLRPRMGDPRLWVPLDRELTDLTDEERAEIYLRGMIQDWNDSVAVAVALSGEATDWTFTDEEGRRWGLSPGRLHLGDFSIPLPISFQLPPGRRDEMAMRNWELRDIMRGSATAAVRESWAERAREIRERLEAERAERQGSGNSGGSGGGGSGSGSGSGPGQGPGSGPGGGG